MVYCFQAKLKLWSGLRPEGYISAKAKHLAFTFIVLSAINKWVIPIEIVIVEMLSRQTALAKAIVLELPPLKHFLPVLIVPVLVVEPFPALV
jgi:hypothetical protein